MKAFAVYLCGDELPSAIFPYCDNATKERAMEEANKFPEDKPRWMDKRIVEMFLADQSNVIQDNFTLYDDDSVRKKLTIMDKFGAMMDDSRNPTFNCDAIEKLLTLGKTYQVSLVIEEKEKNNE